MGFKTEWKFKRNIKKILKHGYLDENPRPKYLDGTPAHTKFITHVSETYNLEKGDFPVTQLRQVAWKSGIKEILWIYQDQSNSLKLLRDKYNIYWWDDWNIGDDTIGQRYGATVKKYNIINNLIHSLKNDPFSRRHIIDLYQYEDFEETDGLHPCAYNFTITAYRKNGDIYLDGLLYQRSSDYLTAGHINKIQYTSLLMMLAHECGYKVGKFTHTVACLHIYDRHYVQAKVLLKRRSKFNKPKLILNAKGKGFYDITIDDFELVNYNPTKPQLKFPLGI